MKKIFSYSLAFLLLFPCLLCAKSIAVSETQATGGILSSPELLYLTDVLREEAVRALPSYQDWTVMNRESSVGTTNADYNVQAQISKFGSSLVVSTEMYESSSNTLVASYTGKGATVEDIERIFREQSPAFFQKLVDQNANNANNGEGSATFVIATPPQEQAYSFPAPDSVVTNDPATQDSTVATSSDSATQVPTATSSDSTTQAPTATSAAADSTQPKPEAVATTAKDTSKAALTVKEEKPTENQSAKPKNVWGGFTVGITYNDYHSTKFGLNDIKPGKNYDLTVEGADDLSKNFWGIGFRAGFSGLFVASPFFSLRGDLNIALRQGTGKANTSVILSWDDEDYDDEKNDLKIEYTATQLNIDLPLLARVSIPNAIYFEVGPMFSFNVYSKSKSTIKEYHGSKTFEEKGGLKAFEFDLATGIGVSRNIGNSMLDFDLRLVIGMTRISDSKDSPKTWQGQLNITYWFL